MREEGRGVREVGWGGGAYGGGLVRVKGER